MRITATGLRLSQSIEHEAGSFDYNRPVEQGANHVGSGQH